MMMAARVSVSQDANYVGAGSQAAPPPATAALVSYPRPPATAVEARVQAPAPLRPVAPAETVVTPAETTAAQNVDMKDDGWCKVVKAGDVVHYQLTIRSADAARAVYANLQLRRNGGKAEHSDLPYWDPLMMGERGVATRDAQAGNLYHFEFTVEPDVPSGLYYGTDVLVTLSADGGVYPSPHYVDVTRHTRREIHHYCLAVAGKYGGEIGGGRPLVTDFKPGAIERK